MLSLQQPDRVGGQGGDSAHNVPAGTRRADGRRRLQQDERPSQVRCSHHAGRPRSENSHGGIAQAFSDNIPILYLAGGPALGQYAVRPNFSPVRSYQSVSKHAEVITAPEQVAAVMRRAFHNLRNGRGRAGDRGDTRRCGRPGGAGVGPCLPAAEASAAGPVPAAMWPMRPVCC